MIAAYFLAFQTLFYLTIPTTIQTLTISAELFTKGRQINTDPLLE